MSRPGSSAFSMRQITCAFAPSARNGGLALDARAASSNISARCANIRLQRAHQGSPSTGISGMGKTMLVEKFRRDHPPAFNSAVGFETSPVLAISLTSRPTERRVYAQLLMALGVSVNERATLLELEIKAIRLLKDSMVRVLVFDEVHNLLAGSPREQRVILQLFRHLSNELKASLVCLAPSHGELRVKGESHSCIGQTPRVVSVSEVRARLQNAARFRARSTSHTVAVQDGCTKIPLAAGRGSGGRNHSVDRHFRPWLLSVRPPGSARTDQVLEDLILC